MLILQQRSVPIGNNSLKLAYVDTIRMIEDSNYYTVHTLFQMQQQFH